MKTHWTVTGDSLQIKENLSVFFDGNKIASIYKGDNIFKPKLIISNNQFITKANYILLKEKIENDLGYSIREAFTEQSINIKTSNQSNNYKDDIQHKS